MLKTLLILQGALPPFDTVEDDQPDLDAGSIQKRGGPVTLNQINTDDIINAIGYGPLQVRRGQLDWSVTKQN